MEDNLNFFSSNGRGAQFSFQIKYNFHLLLKLNSIGRRKTILIAILIFLLVKYGVASPNLTWAWHSSAPACKGFCQCFGAHSTLQFGYYLFHSLKTVIFKFCIKISKFVKMRKLFINLIFSFVNVGSWLNSYQKW